MNRRRLLQLGLGAAAVVAIGGGTIALVRPGLSGGRLTPTGRAIFSAVAAAVLEGSLPTEPGARDAALQSHLSRVDQTIAGLPAPVQAELGQLLALLGTAAGRLGLAGLGTDWPQAPVAQVHEALQAMRISSVALRQQAYLALRELTNAAYFSHPTTWAILGYPGPLSI